MVGANCIKKLKTRYMKNKQTKNSMHKFMKSSSLLAKNNLSQKIFEQQQHLKAPRGLLPIRSTTFPGTGQTNT